MKVSPVYSEKSGYGAGCVEIVIWRVPRPVPPSGHPFKYRLVYVAGGERVVGYDNEC
jgi:hypothetical protein